MQRWFVRLFVLVFLLVSNTVFAQDCHIELRGRVIDLHENISLESALILLNDDQFYTYSDSNGLFLIEGLCPGSYKLTISHPSCDALNKTIDLKADYEDTFYLEHHITALSEVIINDQNAQKKVETTPEALIQKNQLDRFAGQSLGDALSQVAGVTTLKTGNVIVKPVLHGMYGARVAMVADGVRVNDQEWGADHAPSIDLNAVEQISVVKGAATLRYGGDTPGGVIIMEKSKSFLKDTLFGHVISSLASNGKGAALTSNLVRGFSNGKYLKGQATLKKRGDVSAPDYNLSNTGWTEAAISFQLGSNKILNGWEIDYSFFKNTIGILRSAHIGNVEDLERALSSTKPLRIESFTYTIAAPKQQSQHHNAKLNYFKRWDDNSKLEVYYNFQWNQRKEFDVRRGEDRNMAAIDLQLMTQNIALHYAWKGIEGLRYTTGIQALLQDNFSNPETGVKRLIPDYLQYNLGAYATAHFSPNNQWALDVGGRLDWSFLDAQKYYSNATWAARGYDLRYASFEVRQLATQILTRPQFEFYNWAFTTGARYQLSSNFEGTISYNLSQRAPNAAELFSDGLHHALATIEYGNLDLKKEIAHKILFNGNLSFGSNTWNITPYISWIKDYILLEPGGFEQTIRGAFPYYNYKGVDAQFLGMDMEAQWVFTPTVALRQQLSWVRAKETRKKRDLIHIPPLSLSQSILLTHPKRKYWKWEIFNTTVLKQQHYPNNNFDYQFIENGQLTSKQIDISTPPDGYSIWGTSLTMNWKFAGQRALKFQITIDNLFDVSYRDYLNRLRFYADEIGRNIQLMIKYNL